MLDWLSHRNPAKDKADVPVTAPWIKRPYVAAEDEDGVLSLWLKSYARSAYGLARRADETTGPHVRAYWAEQAPLVEALLRSADTELVMDPDRVHASEHGPAVFYGFACTSGDTVHYVCVKRSAVKAGLGADIVRELLGSRLERPCGYTHELVEMRSGACGVRLPRDWYSDSTFLARRVVGARGVAGEGGCVRWGRAA